MDAGVLAKLCQVLAAALTSAVLLAVAFTTGARFSPAPALQVSPADYLSFTTALPMLPAVACLAATLSTDAFASAVFLAAALPAEALQASTLCCHTFLC